MRTKYDVEEWAIGTTLGRQVFNYNYRMLGTEIMGWELLKVVTMQEGRDATERVYLWQSKSCPGHEMVRANLIERHHWRLAQESLYEHLTHCMRSNIPRGTKKLAQVGDVNFVGREPQTELAAAISFVRGNVCVIVSSIGEKTADVSKIAITLDRALGAHPSKREVANGRVRVQTPKVAIVKANEAYILIKNLQAVAPRGGWLKVIVPDGELSRKENELIYVSEHSGKKLIGTYVRMQQVK